MARERKSFSPEFRETAAREVVENSRSIASVAREIGVHDTTLGNWVRATDVFTRRTGTGLPVRSASST
ncbi:MAG: transposase [Catenulispora sp.]